MRTEVEIAIIGGGLAGLAAAWAAGSRAVLFEKEARPGGQCRSFEVNGFTFDLTGHLLHRRGDKRLPIIEDRGTEGLKRIERNAAVYAGGKIFEYPIQVHTHGLPAETLVQCLVGFAEAARRRRVAPTSTDFAGWLRANFGEGFSRLFFFPYNEKFWKLELAELTAEWASWSVPRPSIREVVEGALGRTCRGLGYNPWFYYPEQGGIESLPRVIQSLTTSRIATGSEVRRVMFEARTIGFADGSEVKYDKLISTIPLPDLIRMSDAPDELKRQAGRLRHVQVLDINLGIDREDASPYQWIYFPEKRFPFYRVGSYSAICRALAPPGTSSFYVEISHPQGARPDIEPICSRAMEGLGEAGLLKPSDKVLARHVAWIDPAYVVYDHARPAILEKVREYLRSREARSIGRYGGWEYSSMVDALEQGVSAGRQALSASA